MTGFGRAAFELDGVAFAVEIRTVNHRHLDLSVRLPRSLAALEAPVRAGLRGKFARGKVEVSIASATGSASSPAALEVDTDLARRYLEFAQSLREEAGAGGDLDVATLISLPGVARVLEHAFSAEDLETALIEAVESGVDAALEMRAAEGEALERELRARLGTVAQIVAALEEGAPEILEAVLDRLRKRADQIRQETGLGEESRLHQEIVIAADRLDVTEELVRMRSHLEQFGGVLDAAGPGQPVGRRLDFLLQEMLREANTLGSKANDAAVAHRVIDLKTELERIREQVQNVE